MDFWNLKAWSLWHTFSNKATPYFLNNSPPRKHSNIWAYGAYSHSKNHTIVLYNWCYRSITVWLPALVQLDGFKRNVVLHGKVLNLFQLLFPIRYISLIYWTNYFRPGSYYPGDSVLHTLLTAAECWLNESKGHHYENVQMAALTTILIKLANKKWHLKTYNNWVMLDMVWQSAPGACYHCCGRCIVSRALPLIKVILLFPLTDKFSLEHFSCFSGEYKMMVMSPLASKKISELCRWHATSMFLGTWDFWLKKLRI